MFNYTSVGTNWDLSLSSVRHTTTKRRTNTAKIKKFNKTSHEKSSEAVKTLNLSLKLKTYVNWTIYRSQWAYPFAVIRKSCSNSSNKAEKQMVENKTFLK